MLMKGGDVTLALVTEASKIVEELCLFDQAMFFLPNKTDSIELRFPIRR